MRVAKANLVPRGIIFFWHGICERPKTAASSRLSRVIIKKERPCPLEFGSYGPLLQRKDVQIRSMNNALANEKRTNPTVAVLHCDPLTVGASKGTQLHTSNSLENVTASMQGIKNINNTTVTLVIQIKTHFTILSISLRVNFFEPLDVAIVTPSFLMSSTFPIESTVPTFTIGSLIIHNLLLFHHHHFQGTDMVLFFPQPQFFPGFVLFLFSH